MTIYEDTNPKKLGTLLYEIHQGMSVLPDFQRDFVWEPSMIRGLLVSIASRYPAGSLLRVRNTKQHFAWRAFEGATRPLGLPTFLILDGQQRLTSLYQAFYGVGDYRFYLRLSVLQNGGDIDDAVFYEKVNSRIEKQYRDRRTQANELVLPLEILRGQHTNLSSWIFETAAMVANQDMQQLTTIHNNLNALAEKWLKPIEDYDFPVVTLSDDTEPDAICTIFETLNRTGVKLTVFELLTARFYPTNINLRAEWDKAQDHHSIFEDYHIDPYQILQAVTLRTTDDEPGRAITCKKGPMLKLRRDDIDTHWHSVVAALAKGLELLRDDCGVVNGDWLPYTPMLVPLMAVLAKHPLDHAPDSVARRAKIARWFWCASLSARYDSAANTRSEEDYDQMSKWLAGGPEPYVVNSFSFDPSILSEVTPRQRARYRALMCLALRSDAAGQKDHARDFNSGGVINAALVRQEIIDDHHIFPRNYLSENPQPKASAVDSILNRTLIDAVTNRQKIRDRAPSDYLGDVKLALTNAGMGIEGLLRSHMIRGDSEGAVWRNDFGDFLNERKSAFERAIIEVTGGAGTSAVQELAEAI